ncbi:ricin-type beta-trefoil lectin domain protein [Streptomyces sp. JH002]
MSDARFAETFARAPARAPRGLVPGRRVWTSLGSGVVLAAATVLAVPLLSANVFDSGNTELAADVRTPEFELPPLIIEELPSEEPEEELVEEEEEEAEEEKEEERRQADPPAAPPPAPPVVVEEEKKADPPAEKEEKKNDPPAEPKNEDPPAPYITRGNVQIKGLDGKCLDVANSRTDNGTPATLFDCNGSNAQKWNFWSDGTLRAMGNCLSVVGAKTTDGTLLHMWDCTGNATQRWAVSPNNDIVNISADKCLDVPWADSSSGIQLQIAICSGNPAQKWTISG